MENPMAFKLDLNELRYDPTRPISGKRRPDPTDPKVHDKWMDRQLTARSKNEPLKANPNWIPPTDPQTGQKKISQAGMKRELTPELDLEIKSRVFDINDTVRLRRQALEKLKAAQNALRAAEDDLKQINRSYDRQLRKLANMGTFPEQAYEDLSDHARKNLKLYRD